MKHEYHGFTHAYDHNDLVRLTKAGWESEEAEKKQEEKKKPGRPPKGD